MIKNKEKELQGVKAIIHLQSIRGIKETKKKATIGWRGMSEGQQEFTLELSQNLKGK